jgi:hypothetical protein
LLFVVVVALGASALTACQCALFIILISYGCGAGSGKRTNLFLNKIHSRAAEETTAASCNAASIKAMHLQQCRMRCVM